MPVIPGTREAEAGELIEPRRQRLQWAENAPLHSSLETEQGFVSKTKEKKRKEYGTINKIQLIPTQYHYNQ